MDRQFWNLQNPHFILASNKQSVHKEIVKVKISRQALLDVSANLDSVEEFLNNRLELIFSQKKICLLIAVDEGFFSEERFYKKQ